MHLGRVFATPSWLSGLLCGANVDADPHPRRDGESRRAAGGAIDQGELWFSPKESAEYPVRLSARNQRLICGVGTPECPIIYHSREQSDLILQLGSLAVLAATPASSSSEPSGIQAEESG